MPVADVSHDLDTLTLTITADFAAPAARVWEVYADPRQLERVWGPPTFPATFVDHEVEEPRGFNVYSFTETDGGTRATFVGTYASAESLQQVLDMGVVEGSTAAINQIDDLLAA